MPAQPRYGRHTSGRTAVGAEAGRRSDGAHHVAGKGAAGDVARAPPGGGLGQPAAAATAREAELAGRARALIDDAADRSRVAGLAGAVDHHLGHGRLTGVAFTAGLVVDRLGQAIDVAAKRGRNRRGRSRSSPTLGQGHRRRHADHGGAKAHAQRARLRACPQSMKQGCSAYATRAIRPPFWPRVTLRHIGDDAMQQRGSGRRTVTERPILYTN